MGEISKFLKDGCNNTKNEKTKNSKKDNVELDHAIQISLKCFQGDKLTITDMINEQFLNSIFSSLTNTTINNNDIISAKSMKKLIGYITFLNIIPIEYFRKDDIKTLFLFLFLIDKWIFTTVSTISQLKCSLLCRNLLLKFMKWNSSIIIDFLVCYVFVCVVYLLVMLIL